MRKRVGTKRALIMLRMSKELRDLVEQLARMEKRTLSGYVRCVLEDHVESLKGRI